MCHSFQRRTTSHSRTRGNSSATCTSSIATTLDQGHVKKSPNQSYANASQGLDDFSGKHETFLHVKICRRRVSFLHVRSAMPAMPSITACMHARTICILVMTMTNKHTTGMYWDVRRIKAKYLLKRAPVNKIKPELKWCFNWKKVLSNYIRYTCALYLPPVHMYHEAVFWVISYSMHHPGATNCLLDLSLTNLNTEIGSGHYMQSASSVDLFCMYLCSTIWQKFPCTTCTCYMFWQYSTWVIVYLGKWRSHYKDRFYCILSQYS